MKRFAENLATTIVVMAIIAASAFAYFSVQDWLREREHRVIERKSEFGWIERDVTCGHIYGWAWNPWHPNEPVTVVVRYGDKILATAKADIYRGDLETAGVGNGKHGFDIKTDMKPIYGSLRASPLIVEAKVGNSMEPIGFSGQIKLSCAGAQ